MDDWYRSMAPMSSDRHLWLTSGEHRAWSTPRNVRVAELVQGPRTGETYARCELITQDNFVSSSSLLLKNRFESEWKTPSVGEPCEVAVWLPPRSGVGELAGDSSYMPYGSPSAWCTLCATRQEAEKVFLALNDGLEGVGW